MLLKSHYTIILLIFAAAIIRVIETAACDEEDIVFEIKASLTATGAFLIGELFLIFAISASGSSSACMGTSILSS